MKKKTIIISMVIMFVMMITSITVSAAALINSKEVIYDNSKSGLKSTNVQAAVDELYSSATDYSSLNNKIDGIIDKIYPVGSIYMSTTDSTIEKVSERFGGTWERYAEGRTIIGVGTGTDSNGTVQVFNANETLGEYTHKLTINEMPRHSHSASILMSSSENPWTTFNSSGVETFNPYIPTMTGETGGSGSHNNIQPYIAVYMYKRVK